MYVNAYWPLRRLLPSKCLGVQTAHGNDISLPLLLQRLLKNAGKAVLSPCAQTLKHLQRAKCLSQEQSTRLERMPTARVIDNDMDVFAIHSSE